MENFLLPPKPYLLQSLHPMYHSLTEKKHLQRKNTLLKYSKRDVSATEYEANRKLLCSAIVVSAVAYPLRLSS